MKKKEVIKKEESKKIEDVNNSPSIKGIIRTFIIVALVFGFFYLFTYVLVGDFGTALLQVINDYHPDRVIIEPSGVGKLSDVIRAVEDVAKEAELVKAVSEIAAVTSVSLISHDGEVTF